MLESPGGPTPPLSSSCLGGLWLLEPLSCHIRIDCDFLRPLSSLPVAENPSHLRGTPLPPACQKPLETSFFLFVPRACSSWVLLGVSRPPAVPSHLPPAACLGGKELMGPVPVPRPAHWTVTEAQGDCCTGFRSGVGGGGFETFLSLLCAWLLQVCYCLQGYLSLLGLLP